MAFRSSTLLNKILIALLIAVSKLPFQALYALSDFMAVLLQYIFKYRRKVIHDNLVKAFPEKSESEIRQIMKTFYRHFCDITLESVKAWSMTGEEFESRNTYRGLEDLNRCFDQGKSVILLGMHYNNWEWSAYAQVKVKHTFLVVYNPVRGNQMFEDFILKMREKWGSRTIPVHKSARTVMEFHKLQVPICLALAADQRPPVVTRFWVKFLNQEACFHLGPEKIAQRTNQPIYFHLTRKIARGKYETSFIPMIEEPAGVSSEIIMTTYVRMMEKYIREAPEYYLWSHKRWKQVRPDGYPLYG